MPGAIILSVRALDGARIIFPNASVPLQPALPIRAPVYGASPVLAPSQQASAGEPAVHMQYLSGHPLRLPGEQENRYRGNVLRRADAFEGMTLGGALALGRLSQKA